ncbi:hypothetical protein ABIA24_006735 [Sinorhizobium fredii]|uniref:hypothetical protein n=1 Tax=Rhizobium fredii TaxID=380 RepID=UPI0035157D81
MSICDPADDAARALIKANREQTISEYRFKIPLRRKNRLGAGVKWDPIWPNSVKQAANELNIEFIQVNDQARTRTREEADKVSKLAESIWNQEHEQFAILVGDQ